MYKFTYKCLLFIIFYVDYRMSTEIIRPTRSISYNDIKKRRMLRQSKSKNKLKSSNASTSIVQTEKKVYGFLHADQFANQKLNQIDQIKDQNMQINVHASRQTVKRSAPLDHYINFTDRIQSKKTPISIRQENRGIQQLGCRNSRQIVNDLIQQSKSQRKLIMYRELRNKFKLSKSRQRSKSSKSLAEKSKILARKLIDIENTPEKPRPLELDNIKNANRVNRIKRFQSVNQAGPLNVKQNYRYLVTAPRQSQQNKQAVVELFKGQRSKRNTKIQQIESSIEVQKQSAMFDSQDDKFLQQMCLKFNKKNQNIVSEVKKPKQKEIISPKKIKNQKNKSKNIEQIQSCQNILALLDVQQDELSKVFHKKQRQKKILHDLQKLNKKFPAGFFKL